MEYLRLDFITLSEESSQGSNVIGETIFYTDETNSPLALPANPNDAEGP